MPDPTAPRRPGRRGPLPSLWELGGLTPRQLLKGVAREAMHDDILSRAAQLSYYFMLALFPMLLFLLTLMGLILGDNPGARDQLFGYLGSVLPPSAADLVGRTIQEVTQAAGGAKLTFGIVFTLWAAMGGMNAIIATLNVVYDISDSRPYWKRILLSAALTVAIAILVIAALMLVLFGPQIASWLGAKLSLGAVFEWTWKVLQFPGAFAFMAFAFALIYYFAPDVEQQKWYWITPGSLLGVLLWLGASGLFRLYLQYFDRYSKTYGSLGAVIVLMLWLYVTGVCILLGGEVNAEIEHAAAARGRADAKAEGEKQAPAA